MSEAHKGHLASEETKKKMSEAHKKIHQPRLNGKFVSIRPVKS